MKRKSMDKDTIQYKKVSPVHQLGLDTGNQLTTVSRRDFMKTGSLASLGLVIGINLVNSTLVNASTESPDAAGKDFEPNV